MRLMPEPSAFLQGIFEEPLRRGLTDYLPVKTQTERTQDEILRLLNIVHSQNCEILRYLRQERERVHVPGLGPGYIL